MPDRLSRLAAAIRTCDGPVVRHLAYEGANDNAGPIAGRDGSIADGPPEPRWEGPGAILALGMQDGRHGLGAVRAAAGEITGDAATDMATLLRLLAHYGMWLGFEGRAESVKAGKMRRLPMEVGAQGRVEYRLDLRRITRRSQQLTADGTILLNGRPAATLDGLSIAFRPLGTHGPERSRLGA